MFDVGVFVPALVWGYCVLLKIFGPLVPNDPFVFIRMTVLSDLFATCLFVCNGVCIHSYSIPSSFVICTLDRRKPSFRSRRKPYYPEKTCVSERGVDTAHKAVGQSRGSNPGSHRCNAREDPLR